MAAKENEAPKTGPYSEEKLLTAIAHAKDGKSSIRKTAVLFGIPYPTLRRHVSGEVETSKRGPRTHLGQKNEKELSVAVHEFKDINHAITKQELIELAAATAEKMGKPFKKTSGEPSLPSQQWFRKFKKRHNLVLRTPENISTNRVNMETPEVKQDFFDKLKAVYEECIPQGLGACQIYNFDETGACVVTKSGKVIAAKGSKIVRVRKGGERGENITVAAAVNASGTHVLPPLIIFRGKSLNLELTKDGLEGAIYAHAPKSFIDSEIFMMWFKRFVESIPPKRPVLLILDGHASHINLPIIQYAKERGIIILCLPPHTTHLYQPLDLSIFGPFKKHFDAEGRKLMRKNKKHSLNRYDFNRVLKPAWQKTMTQSNITAGFEKAGIWPFNPDAVVLPSQAGHYRSAQSQDASQPQQELDTNKNSAEGSALNSGPCALEINQQEAEDPSNMSERESSQQDSLDHQPQTTNHHQLAEASNSVFGVQETEDLSATNSCEEDDPGEAPIHIANRSPSTEQETAVQAPGGAEPETPTLVSLRQSNSGLLPNAEKNGNLDASVSPVVAAIREFLTPVQETPKPKTKQITKTRLITSPEFLAELLSKEKEKEEKQKAKEAALIARREKKTKQKAKKVPQPKKRPNPTQQTKEKPERKKTRGDEECSEGHISDSENSVAPNAEHKTDRRSIKEGDKPKKKPRRDQETKKVAKRRNPKKNAESSEEETSDSEEKESSCSEDDERCGTCNGSFQKDFHGEQWIKCSDLSCGSWFHLACQGLTQYRPDFICDECLPLGVVAEKC